MRDEVVKTLLTVQIQPAPQTEPTPDPLAGLAGLEGVSFQNADYDTAVRDEAAESSEEILRVGRNQDCPCGSGKKYKHCHGRLA